MSLCSNPVPCCGSVLWLSWGTRERLKNKKDRFFVPWLCVLFVVVVVAFVMIVWHGSDDAG